MKKLLLLFLILFSAAAHPQLKGGLTLGTPGLSTSVSQMLCEDLDGGSEYLNFNPKYVSVGLNLLQGWDFTQGWSKNIPANGVINNSTTWTAVSDNLGITKNCLIAGRKYVMVLAGTQTGTAFLRVGNLVWNTLYSGAITEASFNKIIEFTAVDNWLMLYKLGGIGSVTITSLELYEASGSLDMHGNPRFTSSANSDFETGISTGANIVNNGTFTNWTGTKPNEVPTGWEVNGNNATNYVTNSSGSCRIVSDNGSNIYIRQAVLTVGKLYSYSINIKAISGTINLYCAGSGSIPQTSIGFNSTGVKTGTFVAGSIGLIISRSGVTDATFDDIIIQEVLSDYSFSGNCSGYITGEQKHGGNNSLKYISTAAGDATANYTYLASSKYDPLQVGSKYCYEQWVYDAGTKLANSLTGDNTSFTSSVGSWAAYDINSTLLWETDHAKVTLSAYGYGGMKYMSVLTSGKTYYVSIKARLQSGSAVLLYFGNSTGSISFSPNSTAAVFSGYFTCQSSGSCYIYSTQSNGSVYEVDDIIIQEITPTSLALQIGDISKTFALTAGQWQKIAYTFTATSNTVGKDIKLWASQNSTLYLDDCYIGNYTPMSFMGWFRTNSNNALALFSKGTGASGNSNTTDYGINAVINVGTLYFGIRDGYKSVTISSAVNTLNDNKWHFYVITADMSLTSDQVKTYIDGSLRFSTNFDAGNSNNSQSFTIGKRSYSNADYYSGQIGPEVIKRRVVTQSEISIWNKQGYISKDNSDVFYMDWKGTTTAEMLQDRSPVGNNLTGVNIDLSDRIKVVK